MLRRFALIAPLVVQLTAALSVHAPGAPHDTFTVALRGRVAKAASLLEERGRAAGSSQLEALALRVGSESIGQRSRPQNLDEVKALLRRMLSSAQAAHSADVGLNEFCTSEVHNSKASLEKLQDRKEKEQADFDKLSAQADELAAKTADRHADIAKAQKSMLTATEDRAKARAVYEKRKAEAEREESKHGGLPETTSVDDAAARAAVERAADAALQERIKIEQAEAVDNLAFERAENEGKENIQRQTAQIKNEERSLLKMRADLVDSKQDLRGIDDQFAASQSYEQQIAKKCAVPSDSPQQRAQHREEHIRSLKDAYTILSGDDEALLS